MTGPDDVINVHLLKKLVASKNGRRSFEKYQNIVSGHQTLKLYSEIYRFQRKKLGIRLTQWLMTSLTVRGGSVPWPVQPNTASPPLRWVPPLVTRHAPP